MKMRKGIVALALCVAVSVGGVGAYALYTASTDVVENVFTIRSGSSSSGASEIIEANWDPTTATALQPNQEIIKDPAVKSGEGYDGWVIMRVDVPVAEMKVLSSISEIVRDILQIDVTTIPSEWTLLKSEISTTIGVDSVYYYGYTKVLKPGETTTPCFTKMNVPDMESLKTTVTDTVNVSATIVQDDGFTSVQEAWDVLGLEVDGDVGK